MFNKFFIFCRCYWTEAVFFKNAMAGKDQDGSSPNTHHQWALCYLKLSVYSIFCCCRGVWICVNCLYHHMISKCLIRPHVMFQVLEYDYYGSYEYAIHKNYLYKELLNDEYTFDFPKHHHVVSWVINFLLSSRLLNYLYCLLYKHRLCILYKMVIKYIKWCCESSYRKVLLYCIQLINWFGSLIICLIIRR